MKVGFISDTHGSKYFFDMAMKYLGDCDHIIHTGDVLYHGPRNDLPGGYDPKTLSETLKSMDNVFYVQGNCDSFVDMTVVDIETMPLSEVFTFGELKIYAHHGDRIPEFEAIQKAYNRGAQIIVSGHTHIKKLEKNKYFLMINPGSNALPKDGVRSVAKYDNGKVMLIDIEDGTVLQEMDM